MMPLRRISFISALAVLFTSISSSIAVASSVLKDVSARSELQKSQILAQNQLPSAAGVAKQEQKDNDANYGNPALREKRAIDQPAAIKVPSPKQVKEQMNNGRPGDESKQS